VLVQVQLNAGDVVLRDDVDVVAGGDSPVLPGLAVGVKGSVMQIRGSRRG
jgi:hypothetical protein